MPKLSACIEMVYGELPFADRFAAAKASGRVTEAHDDDVFK